MKKISLIALLIGFASGAFSQENLPVTFTKETDGLNASFSTPTNLNILNDPDKADAYPWISYDGLRLYYTKEEANGDEALYIAQRSSLFQDFEQSRRISFQFPGELISAWLTKDEKTMIFASKHVNPIDERSSWVFAVERESTEDDFKKPKPLTLIGIDTTFISGCSFTENMEEMFLFASNEESFIIILHQVGDLTYQVKDTLPVLENGIIHPGQLSKDGLKFYTTIDFPLTGQSSLFEYSRTSLKQKFTRVKPCFDMLQPIESSYNQPSTSANEEVLACVSSKKWWSENELSISIGDQNADLKQHVNPLRAAISLYPNPVSKELNVKLPTISNTIHLEIYSLDGRLIAFHDASETSKISLDVSYLDTGLYVCKIILSDGSMSVQRFTKVL
jgi:hypothetical protein